MVVVTIRSTFILWKTLPKWRAFWSYPLGLLENSFLTRKRVCRSVSEAVPPWSVDIEFLRLDYVWNSRNRYKSNRDSSCSVGLISPISLLASRTFHFITAPKTGYWSLLAHISEREMHGRWSETEVDQADPWSKLRQGAADLAGGELHISTAN